MIVWTSWLFVALICSFAALIEQKSRWTTDLPWLYLSWIGSPFLKLARDWKRFSTLSPLFHWNLLSFAAIMFLRKQTFWEDSFQNPRWSLSPDNQFLVQYCLVWTFCIESCWGGCLTVYWSNEPSLGSLWRSKMWGLLVKPSQVSQSLYSFFMDWESLKCSLILGFRWTKAPFFKISHLNLGECGTQKPSVVWIVKNVRLQKLQDCTILKPNLDLRTFQTWSGISSHRPSSISLYSFFCSFSVVNNNIISSFPFFLSLSFLVPSSLCSRDLITRTLKFFWDFLA